MIQAKREKKCKVCRKKFRPTRTTQVVCSPLCAIEYTRQKRKKLAEKAARERRRHTRAAKERLKPRNVLMREAQTAFNAFIRFRDREHPCISCGVREPPERHGGAWDCGHYLTRGAHPELRFEESNAHRQCKRCNGGAGRFSGKGRTVQQEYRERLILRIGLDQVEWLEGPHAPKKYTKDDLRAIRDDYRLKLREAKKREAAI